MVPYLFVFFILALFSVLDNFCFFRERRLIFYCLCSFILIFFAGLRGVGVGSDDLVYVEKFLSIPSVDYWITGSFNYSFSEVWMEPGYILLGAIIRLFTDDYTFLFLSVAFLSVGLASINYYKYVGFSFLSLSLFFVHTFLYRDINQIRAAISAAIALFLISKIHERKHFMVFFVIFLCMSFHVASFVLLSVYFLSYFKINRSRVFFIFIASIIFGYLELSKNIFNLFSFSGFLERKINNYIGVDVYLNSVSLFDITNIKNSFFIILIFCFWNKLKNSIPYFNTIVIFYLLAVCIRIAFWDLGVLAARVSTFFAIVEVVFIPFIVNVYKQKIIVTCAILIYSFLTLYLNLFFKDGRNLYFLSIF